MCSCPPSPDSPACVQGRLRFVFCSSVKNMKEVFICTAEGQRETVRGQVRHCAPQIRMHYGRNTATCVVFSVRGRAMKHNANLIFALRNNAKARRPRAPQNVHIPRYLAFTPRQSRVHTVLYYHDRVRPGIKTHQLMWQAPELKAWVAFIPQANLIQIRYLLVQMGFESFKSQMGFETTS